MAPPPPTVVRHTFRQVVVVSGHMIDRPERSTPRFPAEAEAFVTQQVRSALESWKVDDQALLVCGGARGADIIAAEQAVDLGATAWLLLPLPEEEFLDVSVVLPGTDWGDRFRALRAQCPTWYQLDELGSPPPGNDVWSRNNEWCLCVAAAQAPDGGLRALVVWDGSTGDGPGGTEHFVTQARRLDASIDIIRPLPADRRA